MSNSNVSDNVYQGEDGKRYYTARQADNNNVGHQINVSYFHPHLVGASSCLDFGCGNGGLMPFLREIVEDVEGLEINPVARLQAVRKGFTVHASLDDIPRERLYDVIVSNHVLEHIADVPSILRRLRQQLSGNGKLVLKLPIDDARERHQRNWSRDDIDKHLHTWTPRLIANNLYLGGFDVIGISILTSAWHPRLFWLRHVGLDRIGYWALAILRYRRQLLIVARKDGLEPDTA